MSQPMSDYNSKRISPVVYVTLAIISSALAFISTDIYMPFMQLMAQVLHVHVTSIQASITLFMASLALGNLLVTSLADCFGRRIILLCGLAMALVGTLLLMVPTLSCFMLGRVLQGAGAATGLSLSRVIIRDIARDRQHLSKLYVIFSGILCIAPAASPLIGAYIQHHFGWRAVFIFLAVLYVIHLCVVGLLFAETAGENSLGRSVWPQFKAGLVQVCCSGYFIVISIMSALTFGIYIAYLTALPYIILLELHRSVMVTAWAMASLIIGGLASRISNLVLVHRYKVTTMIQLGVSFQVVAASAYCLFIWSHWANLYTVMLPCIIYSFSSGFLFTSYATTAMAIFKKHLGSVAGMYSCLQVLGAVLLSGLVAINHHNDMLLMAWIFLGSVISILFLNFIRVRWMP